MFQSLFGQRRGGGDIKQINAHELADMLAVRDDLFLLDVRTAGEYEYDGHIEGSHLLPLAMLRSPDGEIPKDKTIVCVCRSGNRSQTACAFLASQGFTNVVNLSGGMVGWKYAGLPHSNSRKHP
jgi:rhodanese-related sulfurtransferase